jgi:hypothetical protein
MKLSDRIRTLEKLENSVDTPWMFSRIFGKVQLFGSQVTIVGGDQQDYVQVDELKKAIEWLVAELDGTVKWKNSKSQEKK